jgi:hypothetical protein
LIDHLQEAELLSTKGKSEPATAYDLTDNHDIRLRCCNTLLVSVTVLPKAILLIGCAIVRDNLRTLKYPGAVFQARSRNGRVVRKSQICDDPPGSQSLTDIRPET